MARTIQLFKDVRRWALVAACAPLVMLAGCPQDQGAAKANVPAQATAPAIANGATGNAGQAATPAVTKAQPVDPARAYKDQQLISHAEQLYRSGVDNYSAGHLDAARAAFNAAVDTMLMSGMDLKGDPQLADEFDHLLNAVNSLEMAALKQGNGFSPAIEAAPLDAAKLEVMRQVVACYYAIVFLLLSLQHGELPPPLDPDPNTLPTFANARAEMTDGRLPLGTPEDRVRLALVMIQDARQRTAHPDFVRSMALLTSVAP